jgi:hypothetical protein
MLCSIFLLDKDGQHLVLPHQHSLGDSSSLSDSSCRTGGTRF